MSTALAVAPEIGLAPAWPLFGILPAMLLMALLGFLAFTVSRSLHAQALAAERGDDPFEALSLVDEALAGAPDDAHARSTVSPTSR